ncbi:hypothetical protein ES703_82391 [subsurface metagenome]
MNIRNWPMDRIMQLPDCCFGRRWPMSLYVAGVSDTPGYDITELALPEMAVFWSLVWWVAYSDGVVSYMRLALGDSLPTAAAQMTALEPLFPGMGVTGAEPRNILIGSASRGARLTMRMPVRAAGRRPVLEVVSGEAKSCVLHVILEVSSAPTEVPDCLLSAHP